MTTQRRLMKIGVILIALAMGLTLAASSLMETDRAYDPHPSPSLTPTPTPTPTYQITISKGAIDGGEVNPLGTVMLPAGASSIMITPYSGYFIYGGTVSGGVVLGSLEAHSGYYIYNFAVGGNGSITISFLALTPTPTPPPPTPTPTPTTIPGPYSVTFTESGLPTGTLWSVGFNMQVYQSTTSQIWIIGISSGTYTYATSAIEGYTCSILTLQSLTVTNQSQQISLTYAPSISPSFSPNPTPSPTSSPTPTLTPTSSPTPTLTPTSSPTPTPIPSPTPTISPTPSPTPTTTPAPTLTPAPPAFPETIPMPSSTLSPSPYPVSTPTLTPVPTVTLKATPTPNPSPAIPPTPVPTLESAPTATSESTPSPTPSQTPTPSPAFQFGNVTQGKDYSNLRAPNTINLCNYTTPPDTGVIVQISLCLTGTPMGSKVRAVIYANDPETQLPREGEPLAQSLDTLNVTSVSGEWYNFTMNFSASQNTVYWLGYSSENFTRYFFDVGGSSLSVTSQPDRSSLLPTVWSYEGKSSLSLRAFYTFAAPKPTSTPTPSNQDSTPEKAQSFQDIIPVFLIICLESGIMVTYRIRKNRNIISKPLFHLEWAYESRAEKLCGRLRFCKETIEKPFNRVQKAIRHIFSEFILTIHKLF